MPMHTIPQNVTSYEDKIVGMFVGRQFIYLAVGGLTAFILISTGGGAAVIIRFILAVGAVGFGAAMALVKIYDRGFDSWVYSYLKAVLGPTEWSWQKQEPLMEILIAPDKVLTPAQEKSASSVDPQHDFNQMRKDAFKSFVAGASKDLDADEQQFLASLNFGAPLPRGTISLARSAPPPMLTPEHPTMAARQMDRPAVTVPTTKPLAPLARSTSGPSYTFEVNGKPLQVTLLNNQRTNRTLSRSLLYGGPLPVPVRGELRLNLDPSFQKELTNLIGFAPAGGSRPAFMAAPAPITPSATTGDTNATAPVVNVPVDQALVQPSALSDQQMDAKLQAAADFRTNAAMGGRHKLQIEKPDQPANEPSSPPAGNSNIASDEAASSMDPMIPTGSGSPSARLTAPTDQPMSETVNQPVEQSGPTDVPPFSTEGATPPNTEPKSEEERLREQLATFEDLARRAQSQLEEERRNRERLEQEMKQQEEAAALQGQHYQDELQRLQQRSADVANQGAKAEQDLAAMQAQAQVNPTSVNPQDVAQQAALVDKLKQEQERSAAFARELVRKLQQTPTVMPAPVVPATAEPIQAPPAAQPAAPVIPANQLPTLSREPNVINGFVFGPDGQFVEGAVVVIKDESGEAKRALKSNKLGQFVVTTPLSNGHYVVEADKKGLNLAILNVELTGQPVPALIIQATPAA